MAITDFLAKNFFPEGDLQQIKAQSLSPREYNIRATEDQIQNMFGGKGGLLKDIIAPAATFGLSLPYDTGQGIVRAFDKFEPDTGILDYDAIPSGPTFKDIGASIAAERPLSSAYERMIGASSGLTNRFQGLRDLFNTSALAKEEPMSIEDFQVQNIEDRPVDSIPSNFLNYRFQNARTPFTPLREGLFSVKNTLDNLKDKGVDVGSAIVKGIGNLVIPGAGFLLSAMKETPEQKSVKDFYEKEFGLDDIGRVQSGIMAGYNPVYGFGGSGLQGAIDKRLATILKTEERKKKKGLKLSQELINRRKELEALKERDRIAKANIAATPGFDVSGGAGGSYDRSFDYGARTREARDRRSSDLGFSDIRLKENIELVGKSPSNINIYKFNYKDDPTTYQGVMAHEVPWANLKHSNGYMMVDYNKVDVEFKKWQR